MKTPLAATQSTSALPRSSADPRNDARRERELIRAALLRAEPSLVGRIMTGPSGSLSIPSTRGGIEIGRMRRSGAPRWVVVSSEGERPTVEVASSGDGAVRMALRAYRRR